MKFKQIIFFVICIFLFSTASFAYDSVGRVVSVSDGDTIQVLDRNGTLTKIRLYGIDAPEKKQDFGQKAGDMLSTMIAGKDIEFHIVDKDSYGRSVAYTRKRN